MAINNFQDLVTAQRKSVFINPSHFAKPVVYTPKDAAALPVFNAHVEIGEHSEDSGEHRQKVGQIWISTEDVAKPAHGDTMTIDGGSEEWEYKDTIAEEEGITVVLIVTDVRPNFLELE